MNIHNIDLDKRGANAAITHIGSDEPAGRGISVDDEVELMKGNIKIFADVVEIGEKGQYVGRITIFSGRPELESLNGITVGDYLAFNEENVFAVAL